ncbi:MAG: hypothetical protein HC897_07205 [Thermoanaerobaculia bacterium]|nr:hypothetical protein [Thermoanaerobaculia bacterium]
MTEAPLFVRSYDLYSWLLDRFAEARSHPELGRAVLEHGRALLEAVALALARFDVAERLIAADEHATVLRAHLRLASEKGLLTDRQLLHATGELRDIGRQIGGWRKRVEAT